MSGIIQYFEAWAPYWTVRENVFLGDGSAGTLMRLLESPVLVVGAGQGLVLSQLRRRQLLADGIDISPQMVKFAKERRGLDLILADAARMPFEDDTYCSTVVSTGVIDLMDDLEGIKTIIREVRRVTRESGRILVAFYRFHRRVEELMRRIGLISAENQWRFRRMHELMVLQPGAFLSALRRDPDVRVLGVLLCLLKIQAFLPREAKRRLGDLQKAWNLAKAESDSPHALIESAPERVPFRGQHDIQNLFVELNTSVRRTFVCPGCILVELAPGTDDAV